MKLVYIVFEFFLTLAVRIKRGVLAEEIETVAAKVEEAAKVQAEEDDLTADAPEEFLDPIMSHLMTDPVILPSSKVIDTYEMKVSQCDFVENRGFISIPADNGSLTFLHRRIYTVRY